MEKRDMKVLDGQAVPWDEGGPARQLEPASAFKTCPQCGALVFADMDTCYGCLFDFKEAEATEAQRQPWAVVGGGIGDGLGDLEEAGDMDVDRNPEQEAESVEDVAALSGDLPLAQAFPENPVEPLDLVASGAPEPASPTIPDPDATCDLGALLGSQPCWGVRMEWRGLQATLDIPPAGLSIGRARDNDLVLPLRAVSRHHVLITVDGPTVTVTDAGARNPAVLAGAPIRSETSWPPGGVLEVCGANFSLVQLDPRRSDAIVNGRF